MPRKRTLSGASARSIAYRQRREKEGWRSKSYFLPPDVVAALDALAKINATNASHELCAAVRAAMDAAGAEDLGL